MALTRLLINIDHVATLRNARREVFPDPVHAATLCEMGGANGIVFHLREDRRHITDRDVRLLRQTVRSKLDFELSTAEEIVEICCETLPDLATLVPERREEVTTEGGLDVLAGRARLDTVIPRLYAAGIAEVALFVDPDLEQIRAAADVGANAIELHTGEFSNSRGAERDARLQELAQAGDLAKSLGMALHAGHGLDYDNYSAFRAGMPDLDEVSIGFAVVARSVLVGMEQAVRDMARLVYGASQ
ncbi:MAG: pyridoxine 5-phosphate synthase [Rhodothermales bacterium]|jgi:pyridoxine 5-phosphate synthase